MESSLLFLCLKIFFCRIIDVSLSSYRTILMVKGKSLVASTIAIFEGLVWFLIVREAITFATSSFIETLYIAFAYSLGLAAGIFIGSWFASKYTGGMIQVQVVTSAKNDDMIKQIQEAGYALTIITSNATSYSGEKYMLFSEIKNSKLKDFKKLVHSLDAKAFIMVNESKYVYNGYIKK